MFSTYIECLWWFSFFSGGCEAHGVSNKSISKSISHAKYNLKNNHIYKFMEHYAPTTYKIYVLNSKGELLYSYSNP